jgi:hypothetical protein
MPSIEVSLANRVAPMMATRLTRASSFVAELVEARMYYDWSTDQLMEESVRSSTFSRS